MARTIKLTKAGEGKRLTYRRVAGQGRAWRARPDQTELSPKQPARRFVRLDTIEYVVRLKEGGVMVVGRRGAAEVHISLPDDLLA
jgi:hypothetical protein